jgi:pimeloyl-ACP methyl ester carboxylesterase
MSAPPRALAAVLCAVAAAVVALPDNSARADGPKDNVVENVRPVPPPGTEIPEADRTEIKKGLAELQQLIKDVGTHDLLPDVQVYEKAVRWALDYNEIYEGKGPKPAANVRKALATGLERARQLKDGKTPWETQTGGVLRGYKSKIDGSVQPYWIVVPKEYDFTAKTEHRLDFWWHGRGENLSEANFMAGTPGTGGGIIPAPGAFVLHPFGRYCNANKFAGEVDTYECLAHAQSHYRIDRTRLVARGFSMGGAACWQFAVHRPGLWAASAPGAGFAETPEFLKVFQNEKVEPTWYETKLWHMYNATDYAENVFNLPTVAYSGEVDSQKQAADVMAREMKKVGLELTHVVGPKTGHGYEKEAAKEVNKRIDAVAEKGRDPWPAAVRFTTYTTRYNRCGWIEIDRLVRHWEPATVEGTLKDGILTIKTAGVKAFTIDLPPKTKVSCVIDGQSVLTEYVVDASERLIVDHVGGKWTPFPEPPVLPKRHGLQGPIDDAFMDAFLMVKPSGKPLNAKVGEWADKEMKHATTHWRSQFRGDAPVKADAELTDADIKDNNLILWGDPASNAVLAKIADKLPIKWTDKGVTVGKDTYDVGTHVPVLIYPNPLNPRKYVVLNSGFTFREYDYLNNARQVPKLPDYAVIDTATPPNPRYPGKVVRAGFFGEKWELLDNDGK